MYLRDCPPFLTRAPFGAVAFVPGVLWSWRILGATGTRRINAGNYPGTGRGQNPANEPTRAPWSRWPQNLRKCSNIKPDRGERSALLCLAFVPVYGPPRGTVRGGGRNGLPRTRPPGRTGDERQNFKKKVWGNY